MHKISIILVININSKERGSFATIKITITEKVKKGKNKSKTIWHSLKFIIIIEISDQIECPAASEANENVVITVGNKKQFSHWE